MWEFIQLVIVSNPKVERLMAMEFLKWIHKATFQGYQPAIDYCKEHGYKWY